MLDRLAFEHLFRYEAARASREERALVFAVIEPPADDLVRCASQISETLGPHDLIGYWGAGVVVVFEGADLAQARSNLERAFAVVREATGTALAGVVRVVLEEPTSHTARFAIYELA